MDGPIRRVRPRETSNCPECKKPGGQTDDTGAYWQCRDGHRWADISWLNRSDHPDYDEDGNYIGER